MRQRVTISIIIIILVLVGCSTPLPPRGDQSSVPNQGVAPSASAGLDSTDFGLAGMTLNTSVVDVRAKLHVPTGHRLGGYQLVGTGTSLSAYLSPGDATVTALAGPITSLNTNNQRLKLTQEHFTATREQVRIAYGTPFKQAVDGDEYWFYIDSNKSQVLIFTFLQARGWQAKDVQIVSFPLAVQQWYPLLGDVKGPAPLSRKDATIGTGYVGMNSDKLEQAYGQLSQEGEARPYWRNQYQNGALIATFDGLVQCIQLRSRVSLATPRGITVGSTAADVRKAYGVARVYPANKGEIWAYENLRQGVGLVFEMRDGVVTLITAGASNYLFWDMLK